MRFHVLTLFPEAIEGPLQASMLGQAQRRGLISVTVTDIRDYTHDAHGTADDYQFGGGPGMVMKPEPVIEAVESAIASKSCCSGTSHANAPPPILIMSPQGDALDQRLVEELAQTPEIVLVCGHYAGVDERVKEYFGAREVSIGDYVLTGGELPALVLIDAISRLVPGVVGSMENVVQDSITSGLLQHPLYTRPAEYRGMAVPEVILSGHHGEIERWRRRESLRRTLEKRPDLLQAADLSPGDLDYLESIGYMRLRCTTEQPQSDLPGHEG